MTLLSETVFNSMGVSCQSGDTYIATLTDRVGLSLTACVPQSATIDTVMYSVRALKFLTTQGSDTVLGAGLSILLELTPENSAVKPHLSIAGDERLSRVSIPHPGPNAAYYFAVASTDQDRAWAVLAGNDLYLVRLDLASGNVSTSSRINIDGTWQHMDLAENPLSIVFSGNAVFISVAVQNYGFITVQCADKLCSLYTVDKLGADLVSGSVVNDTSGYIAYVYVSTNGQVHYQTCPKSYCYNINSYVIASLDINTHPIVRAFSTVGYVQFVIVTDTLLTWKPAPNVEASTNMKTVYTYNACASRLDAVEPRQVVVDQSPQPVWVSGGLFCSSSPITRQNCTANGLYLSEARPARDGMGFICTVPRHFPSGYYLISLSPSTPYSTSKAMLTVGINCGCVAGKCWENGCICEPGWTGRYCDVSVKTTSSANPSTSSTKIATFSYPAPTAETFWTASAFPVPSSSWISNPNPISSISAAVIAGAVIGAIILLLVIIAIAVAIHKCRAKKPAVVEEQLEPLVQPEQNVDALYSPTFTHRV